VIQVLTIAWSDARPVRVLHIVQSKAHQLRRYLGFPFHCASNPKNKRPVALFIDEAHDLNGHTLIGLKRLMEVSVYWEKPPIRWLSP